MSLTNTDPVKVARFPQFAHPTVVTGVRPDDALYRHETFGPLVSVMPCSTSSPGGSR
jgi:acyl-CoA reductase-like NAD-dependent aldehyde dehydrogenase